MRLAGKVAVVTGGAGGIGRATALALGREGAAVVVADIDGDGAAGVAVEIAASGATAVSIRTDLAEERDVVVLIAETVDRFGRLDVLHNNAALTDPEFLSRDVGVIDMTVEVWDRTMAVNLRAQMLTCKHAIPEMCKVGGGSIVNMSSGAALIGDQTRTAYGVSKAGVIALTNHVATCYGRDGVRANTIVPGLILTRAVEAQIPEGMLATLARSTLTPYVGRPDDVADLVVFLASDESRYITGQLLRIDGGMSTHGGHYSPDA